MNKTYWLVFLIFLNSTIFLFAQKSPKDLVLSGPDKYYQNARNALDGGDFSLYLTETEKGIEEAKSAGDSISIAKGFRYYGQYYMNKSNHLVAFDFYRKALEISERINDQEGITASVLWMGILSYSGNDYKEASSLFTQVLPSLKKADNKRQYNTTLYLLGLCKTELKDYKEAEIFLQRALKNFENQKDTDRIYECKTGILQLLVRQNKIREAEELYASSLGRNNKLAESVRPWIEYEMSYLYEQNGFFKKALPHAEQAEKATAVSNISLFMKIKLNKLLSKLYEQNNRPAEAFYYYKKATENKDSLNSEEMAKQLESLKLSTELRSKQTQIDLLNSKVKIEELAKRNYTLIISSLCIFVVLMFLFILTRNKHERELADRNVKLGVAMKKSDDLLLNILPSEVAEELKEKGVSAARQYNNVSVLFTDFVNFSGITELLSPTELVEEIHRNFTAFDSIIEKHGLEKIKTIGDAYLAVCGLPIENEEHAHNTARAALEIRDWMLKNDGRFQIRMGINSGPVVAGIVGVKKYAYDIWGDTVNTAARMEQNSEPGKINISGSTYSFLKDNFNCEYRGKIRAKNKGEVDMYFVSGALAVGVGIS